MYDVQLLVEDDEILGIEQLELEVIDDTIIIKLETMIVLIDEMVEMQLVECMHYL